MTPEEAMNIASNLLLPEKLLEMHVHEEAFPEIWGLLAAYIFMKAHGVPFESLFQSLLGNQDG